MFLHPAGNALVVEVVLNVARQGGHLGVFVELAHADGALLHVGEGVWVVVGLHQAARDRLGQLGVIAQVLAKFSETDADAWQAANEQAQKDRHDQSLKENSSHNQEEVNKVEHVPSLHAL